MVRTGKPRLLLALLLTALPQAQGEELKRRGLFGIQAVAVPEDLRKELNLPPNRGVMASRVIPGSAAEQAGMFARDVIISVQGGAIDSPEQFVQTVGRYRAGDILQANLLRRAVNETLDLTRSVTLKSYPLESAPDFTIEYGSAKSALTTHRTIVTRPVAPGKSPAVLLLGGIGCYSLDLPFDDANAYKKILYHLTRRGLTTFRVEKTGMGDSLGPPCSQADLNAEIAGYAAGLRALIEDTRVDSERIYLLGHSIGGMIAPVLANEFPVRGVIAIGTVGISWFEYELENSRRQGTLAGLSPTELEARMRRKELCAHQLLVEKKTPESILNHHPECESDLNYPAHHTYIQQIADLKLPQIWTNVGSSVLLVYGASDFVTTAKEHLYIAQTVNEGRPGAAEYLELPGMDHYFMQAATIKDSYQRVVEGRPGDFHASILLPIENWLNLKSKISAWGLAKRD